MYKTTDEIFVRINRVGYIPLIGMCGPIPNPIKIPTDTCLKLVNAGIDVHQVDPVTKMTVKLTRENIFDDHKFGKKPVVASAPVKPVVTPAAKVEAVKPVTFTGVPKVEPKVEEPKVEEVVEEIKEEIVEEVAVEETVETEEVVEEAAVEEVKEEATEINNHNNNKYFNKHNKKNK